MEPNAVRDTADDLLAVAVAALAADGASPAPDRQYIAHGAVTWDCELLAVNVVRILPKITDPRLQPCAVLHLVTYAVTLLRCYPVPTDQGNPPSASDLTDAGRNLATDGQALWKGLTRAWVEGEWPVGIPCSRVTWDGLEPLAPSGGLAGWRVAVTVQM